MDYADLLRNEARGSHAQFHQFVLALSKAELDEHYFFFEGDDDPVFYMGQILVFLGDRGHHVFICNGRKEVLKAHEMAARDGRASERVHFFIDKDHNDILSGVFNPPRSMFQTWCYSFENYLVCERVVKRFWVERLHLPSTDMRLAEHVERFQTMHASFMKRLRLAMALILVGRGIDGFEQLKLNLNNVNLDRVLRLDVEKLRVRWVPGATQHFLSASNMTQAGLTSLSASTVRRVCAKYLFERDAKEYVRGKYELWFFVKFLIAATRELSDKKSAIASGLPRAKPKEALSFANCIVQLAPLTATPVDLRAFLLLRLGAPQLGQHIAA